MKQKILYFLLGAICGFLVGGYFILWSLCTLMAKYGICTEVVKIPF